MSDLPAGSRRSAKSAERPLSRCLGFVGLFYVGTYMTKMEAVE